MSDYLYDSLIIGGGPAGMTAAIYSARACLKVAIIEKYLPGGKLTKTLSIENYPGFLENNGIELSKKMHKQVLENDVNFINDEVVSLEKQDSHWVVTTTEKKYFSKTVLIATGSKEKILGIPNEVEYYGNGVSYCAVCDGNLYKNQDVIVVGGGNSATEESLYLSKLVKHVHLIHRRTEFRADPIFVQRIKSTENITIHTPFIPLSVEIENEKVIGLKVKNVITNEIKILSGKCVFFYIGLLPVTEFLKNSNVKCDENGFICVDAHMSTNVDGLFAAGDITSKHLRQVVTALNDGAIAAISIKNYINDHQ